MKKGKILPNSKVYSALPAQILFVYDYAETTAFADSSMFKDIPVYACYPVSYTHLTLPTIYSV